MTWEEFLRRFKEEINWKKEIRDFCIIVGGVVGITILLVYLFKWGVLR